ncbi:hypothetical protein I7I50_07930 [Histoplasma capsulatum G186AR]|uniref:Uncharacterized protein n=1 Tax=Ajellomyces capsulatus TaxID=5037 RepID=A0A8H7YHE7_AJECA|nr:hypothetical protein I7I52_08446 [Histoplasma capsulatum]QSS68494.1 hypothetical protein I7I50_07930 [Histoplasma capsulatum G186AR]
MKRNGAVDSGRSARHAGCRGKGSARKSNKKPPKSPSPGEQRLEAARPTPNYWRCPGDCSPEAKLTSLPAGVGPGHNLATNRDT